VISRKVKNMKPKVNVQQKSGKQGGAQVITENSRGGGYASGKTTETTKPKRSTDKSSEKTRKPF
jgi:hypothetical protein